VAKKADEKKTCFVIGPIGAPDSEDRLHADWLLEEIIEPVMDEHQDFKVERADKLAQPGLIDAQVINLLHSAELVIADLTTLNPNAFYEIGIRHMVQKPIIHMQRADQRPPFDVSLYRAILFKMSRPAELKEARAALKAQVAAVLAADYVVARCRNRSRLSGELFTKSKGKSRLAIRAGRTSSPRPAPDRSSLLDC
jgi:hypothetical protein